MVPKWAVGSGRGNWEVKEKLKEKLKVKLNLPRQPEVIQTVRLTNTYPNPTRYKKPRLKPFTAPGMSSAVQEVGEKFY